nr:hypothetical protein [Tanacetum cinerariifolium]
MEHFSHCCPKTAALPLVFPATSSEGTGTKLGVLDEEKVTSEANVILEWGSKQESEYSKEEDDDKTIKWVDTEEEEEKKDDDDDKSIDLELKDDEETDDKFIHGEEHVLDDDEETDDEFVHGNEQVNDDEDEEMTNAEVEAFGNSDEEISDAAKVDAEKNEEVKDDDNKAVLPPTSSSLSVSLGFGDQFLKLLYDTSLIGKFVQKFFQIFDHNEEIVEDDELDDITDIFKIEGNLFDFETPLCKAFNNFNYLLKIDKDFFTFDIQGTGIYEEYELNNPMTRDLEEPWLDNGCHINYVII